MINAALEHLFSLNNLRGAEETIDSLVKLLITRIYLPKCHRVLAGTANGYRELWLLVHRGFMVYYRTVL